MKFRLVVVFGLEFVRIDILGNVDVAQYDDDKQKTRNQKIAIVLAVQSS